jgi:hypothetical protein
MASLQFRVEWCRVGGCVSDCEARGGETENEHRLLGVKRPPECWGPVCEVGPEAGPDLWVCEKGGK